MAIRTNTNPRAMDLQPEMRDILMRNGLQAHIAFDGGGYKRTVRDGIADQIAAAQIKDGREIELLSEQAKLRHIGDPLLVRLFGSEVPV